MSRLDSQRRMRFNLKPSKLIGLDLKRYIAMAFLIAFFPRFRDARL